MPVYFRGVLGSLTTYSGVQLLPTAARIAPFAIIAGQVLEKTGRYKPIHFGSLALAAMGVGTFSLLDVSSSTGMWVGPQILHVVGIASLTVALLPAIQATTTDADNATSTAAFAYVRGYKAIWGLTIPASISNEFGKRLGWVHNSSVREQYSRGEAYSLATK